MYHLFLFQPIKEKYSKKGKGGTTGWDVINV
jgi:hypothetical protein